MGKTILNLETCGPEKGETLVFLHGFMGCAQSLTALIRPLSDKYRCIAFDLPGHGKSLFGTIDPDGQDKHDGRCGAPHPARSGCSG